MQRIAWGARDDLAREPDPLCCRRLPAWPWRCSDERALSPQLSPMANPAEIIVSELRLGGVLRPAVPRETS